MSCKQVAIALTVGLVMAAGTAEANKGARGPRAARAQPKAPAPKGSGGVAARPSRSTSSLQRQPETAKGRAVHDLEVLTKKTEYRVPDRLTEAQRQEGFHLNRITTLLRGSSHFNGWWDVVHTNTEFVIVRGSAYKGQTVEVEGTHYSDAAIVYKQHEAGNSKTTHLDIMGKAGEEVQVIYWRVSPNAKFEVSGDGIRITETRPHQAPVGDPHWRDVKLTIQPTKSDRAEPVNTHFNYYKHDSYHGEGPQKGYNHLGGDATDDLAREKTVTPM